MKIDLSSKQLFLLAFLLIVITNAFIFVEVAINRHSGVQRDITLSERELMIPYGLFRHDNSGLSLRLSWSTLGDWLNTDKLKSLGFNVKDMVVNEQRRYVKPPISKEVFIVLEYDGDAYKRALQQAKEKFEEKRAMYEHDRDQNQQRLLEQEEKRLKRMEVSDSRLYAIDAGLIPEQLCRLYSDQAKYIIVKGIIEPGYNYPLKKTQGYIKKLSIENIYVSSEQRRLFDGLSYNEPALEGMIEKPHYSVMLRYGSRFEPWIVSVIRNE